ncbi:hypothetical protein [Acinetobacter soli]|uniref:hypothetical protein n=1 Tax=Acinetobacter soli TaxID=487316 RepID=UPI0012505842|nr:hypothetical protein [Acinetobacter soli]
MLEDEGKLTASMCFKCTQELKEQVEGLACMDDMPWSEWIRNAVMEKVREKKRQHEYLMKVFGNTTDTEDTKNTEG